MVKEMYVWTSLLELVFSVQAVQLEACQVPSLNLDFQDFKI